MILLKNLEVYKVSMEIGELVWCVVEKWDYYQKDTLGKQLARAADSIALNIAEGYGRYHFRDNKNFCYYSRGSAYETMSALSKAVSRKLISPADYSSLKTKFERYLRLMNSYIKSIGTSHIKIATQ